MKKDLRNTIIGIIMVLSSCAILIYGVIYINKMDEPTCIEKDYYIGKGSNELIQGNYRIENNCIYFNGRVSCGKFTIEKKCIY